MFKVIPRSLSVFRFLTTLLVLAGNCPILALMGKHFSVCRLLLTVFLRLSEVIRSISDFRHHRILKTDRHGAKWSDNLEDGEHYYNMYVMG